MDDIDGIIQERGSKYGPATIQFDVAQQIKHEFRCSPNWIKLPKLHREALDMIATKLSRILVGDFNYVDHWDDIAGYARVVSERLPK
jgi:hypothetical protein